ncbi:MAG: outer membrane protein assembly factor BamA [Bdellovibrionota bacterium]
MKKRNTGSRLAILGVILGLAIGLGLLTLKEYLASQLVQVLRDEVESACDCKFEVDSAQVSLLQLNAVAINPRVLFRNKPHLNFKRIEASFDLKDLRERRIWIKQLHLIDGFSNGVSPGTPTYEVVKYFGEPLTPEQEKSNKIRLKLIQLKVSKLAFDEDLGEQSLVGLDGNLLMTRNADNNFGLTSDLPKVFINDSDGKSFNLGGIKADLFLHDDYVKIKKISLSEPQAKFDGRFNISLKPDEAIYGEANYNFDTQYLKKTSPVQSNFKGKLNLNGSLDKFSVSGDLSSDPNSTDFFLAQDKFLTLSSILAKFVVESGIAGTSIQVSDISAVGEKAFISTQKPLLLNSQQNSGTLALNIEQLDFDTASLNQIEMTIDLLGTLENPKLSISGEVESITLGNYLVPKITFDSLVDPARIKFKVNHESDDRGIFSVNGSLKLDTKSGRPEFIDTKYELQNFSLLPEDGAIHRPGTQSNKFGFSGAGTLSGLASKVAMRSKAQLIASAISKEGNSAINLLLELNSGKLKLSARDRIETFNANLKIDFLNKSLSTLKLSFRDFEPGNFFSDTKCILISGDLNYNFKEDQPSAGSGNVSLDKLVFGCSPHTVKLTRTLNSQIQNGKFNFNKIEITGAGSGISINGSSSLQTGWDVTAYGKLKINSLLPFFPEIDDMFGDLNADIKITGEFLDPKLDGNLEIIEAGLAVESADILARELNGKLIFEKDSLHIENFAGAVNDGKMKIDGNLNPMQLSDSSISFEFQDVQFQPSEDAYLRFTGALILEQFEAEELGLAGQIDISSAEIRKNFNFETLIGDILSQLNTNEINNNLQGASSLPEIGLAVNINASRNIFLFSNIANVELKGDIELAGTLQDPVARGSLQALSGWFGIKDRKFEISSGQITFDPLHQEPTLSLLAETTTISRLGGTTLVIVEANGPLSNPKFQMSTDSGLPESEILALLGTSGTFSSEKANEAGGFGLEEFSIFGERETGLAGLLSDLTRINEVAIEPDYNEEREATEPSLVAIKHLTDELSLVGQTFLGGQNAPAKGSAVLSLTENFSLSAGIETAAQQEREAIFADVIYTILSDQTPFLRIDFKGNIAESESSLKTAVRINSSSQIPPEEVYNVSESLTQHYKSLGYYDAKVEGSCLLGFKLCKHVSFNIIEGELRIISKIDLQTDIPLDDYKIPKYLDELIGKPASQKTIKEITAEIIVKLRSEGFIGARVFADYQVNNNQSEAELVLKVHAGPAVSFVFSGNTKFKAEKFLDTINIFKRRQPFGGNTIHVLIRNIERLYREKGYLFASISYEKHTNPDGRTIYYVNISEDSQIKVSKVKIKGHKRISLEEIEAEFKTRGQTVLNNLFKPKFAVDEQLQTNARLIESLYRNRGYSNIDVDVAIEPNPISNSTEVIYQINEGEKQTIKVLIFDGLPDHLELPIASFEELSIPQANRKIDETIAKLEDAGYFFYSASTKIDPDEAILYVQIIPGKRTKVSNIFITGNSKIKRAEISNHLLIKKGDFWDRDLISKSKISLLKTSLFSKVDIIKKDVRNLERQLTVRVLERSLRTLKIGTGVNSEFGLRLFADATDKAIFGDGRSLNLRIDTYYDDTNAKVSKGVANLRYSHPNIFSSGFDFSQDARYQRLNNSTLPFQYDRWAASSTIYRSLESKFYTTAGFTFLQDNLTDVPKDAVLSTDDTGVINTSYLSFGLYYDNRDNSFNPDAGYSISIDNQLASSYLGSESDLYQLETNLALLVPIPAFDRRFILANNTSLGSQWTFNDTDYAPISQRFFTGGRTSVRGFRENSLGPKGSEGTIIGGDFLLVNNFELRYLVSDSIEAHGFLDAGSTYLRETSLSLDDLRYSTGAGARFRSPIGPIGLDIGFPLDEQPGEPSVRFHFYIGGTF